MAAPRQGHRVRGVGLLQRAGFHPFNQRLNRLGTTHFQVVHRQTSFLDAKIHTTDFIELIGMYFGLHAKGFRSIEKQFRLCQTEVAFFTERIHVINQPLGHQRGKHVVHHVLGVRHGVWKLRRHRMACQKGCFHRDGQGLLQLRHHAKHLALRLEGQAVARFDLQCTHALCHDCVDASQGVFEEVVFRHGLQRFGRIQDAPAALRDLLIRCALQPHQKFLRPILGKHRMGMAVAPGWDHESPLCIHYGQSRPVGDAWEFRHLSEVHHNATLHRKPRIFQHRKLRHISPCHMPRRLVKRPDQPLDVFEQCTHATQGIPSQEWRATPLATCFA